MCKSSRVSWGSTLHHLLVSHESTAVAVFHFISRNSFFLLALQSYSPKGDVEEKARDVKRVNCPVATGAGLEVRCGKPQEETEGVRWFPPPLPPGVTEQSASPLSLLLLFLPSVPPPAADCAASLPSPLRGEEMRPCDSKRLQAGGIMEGHSGKKKKKQQPKNNKPNPATKTL